MSWLRAPRASVFSPARNIFLSPALIETVTARILRITTMRGLACKKHGVFDKARERAGITGRVRRWLGRSRANKREMYGRKDLICSCRVRFRMRRWWFLREEGETWFQGRGVGEGGDGRKRGWAELIFISVQRGLEGGVNLHVSFATDPSHRRDNGRELKYCPQVLTLLRRSGGTRCTRDVLATLDGGGDGRDGRCFHSEILKTSNVTSRAIFCGIYLLLFREM